MMGLANWFSDFLSNLQIQDGGSISERYQSITHRLNMDFWGVNSGTAHSLYVGSYGRNTAIRGLSDFDMVFELPSRLYYQYDNYTGNGQSALLQAVRTSMQRTYPTSAIGADGQVVIVKFTDGLTFEVLPVFLNNEGSYRYPDSNAGGNWKMTNPRAEIKAMRERNQECNSNLVPLCRMMRSWKGKWQVPIRSMLIDTLAYQFIYKWEHKDKSYLYYDFMCRDFFEYMAAQNVDQEYWQAPGSGQRVFSDKGQFQHKAKRCYNIAVEAIGHEMANPKQEWSAKQKWTEIFGSSYPG